MRDGNPDIDRILEGIEPDQAGSEPLKPEEFDAPVITSAEDLERLERESELVGAPSELTIDEETGAAVEEAAQEVAETAAALESELSGIEQKPEKPTPEEGSWE